MNNSAGYDPKLIAERIVEWGKEKYGNYGWQSQLARELDMSPQSLSQYVKGDSMPGTPMWFKLFKLGLDVNWAISGIKSLTTIKSIKNEIPVDWKKEFIELKNRFITLEEKINSEGKL